MKTPSLLVLVLAALVGTSPTAHAAPIAPVVATYLQGRTTTSFSVYNLMKPKIEQDEDRHVRLNKCLELYRGGNASGDYSYNSDYVFHEALCYDMVFNA